MRSRKWPLAILVLLFVGGYIYEHSRPAGPAVQAEQTLPASEPSRAAPACDGRTYCSQMTSCDEAKYFLKNCPGVQMDGNGDGVPCERQWCNGVR